MFGKKWLIIAALAAGLAANSGEARWFGHGSSGGSRGSHGSSGGSWGRHGSSGGSWGSHGSSGGSWGSHGSSGGSSGGSGGGSSGGSGGSSGGAVIHHGSSGGSSGGMASHGSSGGSSSGVSYHGSYSSHGSVGGVSVYQTPVAGTRTHAYAASRPAAPRTDIDRVHLQLQVPTNAIVYLNNVRMTNTGANRTFYSPAVKKGEAFVYDIRVEVETEGKVQSVAHQQPVMAGDRINLTIAPKPDDRGLAVAAR